MELASDNLAGEGSRPAHYHRPRPHTSDRAIEPECPAEAGPELLANERNQMKTMLMTRMAITVLGLALGLAGAGLARGDDQLSSAKSETEASKAEKLSSYAGSIETVDPPEKTIKVKSWLVSRTFNAGDSCKVSLEDKPQASLSDLGPGQKVKVYYRKIHGVPVAHEVIQENRSFKGHITALDPAKDTIAVKHGMFTRGFVLGEDSKVIVKNDKAGDLENLHIGDTVTVIYRSDNDPLMAHRVEQKNPTFTGTIRAIDARTRTVTARSIMGEKKFHLANGCKIVVNGKTDAGLSDLRIGDRMSVSYEDADGVLVANRIGRETEGGEESEAATASSGVNQPYP
jgi:Cu/Ag efflux protein CusF